MTLASSNPAFHRVLIYIRREGAKQKIAHRAPKRWQERRAADHIAQRQTCENDTQFRTWRSRCYNSATRDMWELARHVGAHERRARHVGRADDFTMVQSLEMTFSCILPAFDACATLFRWRHQYCWRQPKSAAQALTRPPRYRCRWRLAIGREAQLTVRDRDVYLGGVRCPVGCPVGASL